MEYVFMYGLVVVSLFIFFRLIQIVPEQQAWVVEELGKYNKTLGPGLHFVIPFLQKVAYKHSLKEEVLDVRPQVCITQDNVQVTVDGILYDKVVDPYKASYGIENHKFATTQMAQTTMRSEIGKIVLDKTFSERDTINNDIVKAVDIASDPWGIKVTRYEIRDIEPSPTVIDSMEQQMEAERRKRAEILESEGVKASRINGSKGEKEEAINLSKGERQKRINEAEGKANSIEIIADATAQGIKMIAEAIRQPGGKSAVTMQIAEQYITQMGNILGAADVSILPLEAAQVQSMLASILPAAGINISAGGKK